MNIAIENRSMAAKFLADHEQLGNDLESAKLTIEDQRKEIERLDAKIALQTDMLAQTSMERNTYLQYAYELSAQLQFIVAGSARALMIAAQVRNKIAMQASNIPPVPGADIVELEDILHRIGEHNADANDGAGMTNGDPVKDSTFNAMLSPEATGTKPLTSENVETLLSSEVVPIEAPPQGSPGFNGTLVDRDGNPVELSDATKLMKVAS